MSQKHCSFVSPKCIRWHWLPGDQAPWCGLWNCAAHGFDLRRRRSNRHSRLIMPDDFLYDTVCHANVRCHGFQIASAAATIRESFGLAFPDAYLLIFPHVYGSRPPLLPYPHLHLLATSKGTPLALARLEEWQAEMRVSCIAPLGCQSHWKEWRPVEIPAARLAYLYQSTDAHRHLPQDRLPARGLHYRQVYGRPRG